MAHYAFLDENNIVTEVIIGKDEGEDGVNWEVQYGNFRGQTCKRTSYNTRGGVHLAGGTPYRKNYAGIGYTYDSSRDAFIPPKPFPSWTLNTETMEWDPPKPKPPFPCEWNEEKQKWIALVEVTGKFKELFT